MTHNSSPGPLREKRGPREGRYRGPFVREKFGILINYSRGVDNIIDYFAQQKAKKVHMM